MDVEKCNGIPEQRMQAVLEFARNGLEMKIPDGETVDLYKRFASKILQTFLERQHKSLEMKGLASLKSPLAKIPRTYQQSHRTKNCFLWDVAVKPWRENTAESDEEISKKAVEVVRLLVANKVATSQTVGNALHYAAVARDAAAVKFLLHEGHATPEWTWSTLTEAAEKGHEEVAKCLWHGLPDRRPHKVTEVIIAAIKGGHAKLAEDIFRQEGRGDETIRRLVTGFVPGPIDPFKRYDAEL